MTRRRYLIGLSVLLVGAYLLTGVRLIRPGERAVVRRFGRVLDNKPGPGLFVGLPWGLDRVDRVPVHLVRRLEVGYQPDADDGTSSDSAGQFLTGDHNLVNLRVVIHYAVDPKEEAIVHYVLQADRIEPLLARSVEAFLAEWVAARKIDNLLIRGKAELPQVLIQHTQQRLEDYHLGIQIHEASVTYLLPPPEVKPAFDDVTRAQTSISTKIHDAQQQAERALREAQREQYAIEQEAAAYAYNQRRQAQADAERFDERRKKYWYLRQHNADALTAIWWDEMGTLFGKMKETGRIDMLDNHLGSQGLDITVIPPLPKKK